MSRTAQIRRKTAETEIELPPVQQLPIAESRQALQTLARSRGPVDVKGSATFMQDDEVKQEKRPARQMVPVQMGHEQAIDGHTVETLAHQRAHQGWTGVDQERGRAGRLDPQTLGPSAIVIEGRSGSQKCDTSVLHRLHLLFFSEFRSIAARGVSGSQSTAELGTLGPERPADALAADGRGERA